VAFGTGETISIRGLPWTVHSGLTLPPRSPLSKATEVGAWGGQEFARIIQRHMQRKQKYPDEQPAFGMPYNGIENLRPESQAAVQAFLLKQQAAQQ
jgi:arylsulfatase